MGKFRVGDRAIGVKPSDRPDRLGMHGVECTIIAPLRVRRFTLSRELALSYDVAVDGDSRHYRAKPEWLRRKEDKVPWSECVFQPEALVNGECLADASGAKPE